MKQSEEVLTNDLLISSRCLKNRSSKIPEEIAEIREEDETFDFMRSPMFFPCLLRIKTAFAASSLVFLGSSFYFIVSTFPVFFFWSIFEHTQASISKRSRQSVSNIFSFRRNERTELGPGRDRNVPSCSLTARVARHADRSLPKGMLSNFDRSTAIYYERRRMNCVRRYNERFRRRSVQRTFRKRICQVCKCRISFQPCPLETNFSPVNELLVFTIGTNFRACLAFLNYIYSLYIEIGFFFISVNFSW